MNMYLKARASPGEEFSQEQEVANTAGIWRKSTWVQKREIWAAQFCVPGRGQH